MSAPLGVRVCPVAGCGRRIHVTAGGTVYARCIAHTIPLLRVFRDSDGTVAPSGRPTGAALAPAAASRSG